MTATPAWRPARTTDVPRLVMLVQAAYRGPGGWTNEIGIVEGRRVEAAELTETIGRTDAVLAVVPDPTGDDLVACCRVVAGPGDVAHLGLFAVAPGHQDRGLGRGLVSVARALAVERFGARTLEILVVSGQAALLSWYERRGFVATGETRPFGDDPRDRALVPGLHFVILRADLAAPGAVSEPPAAKRTAR